MCNNQIIDVGGTSTTIYGEVHKFPRPFYHDLYAVFQLEDVQKPYSTEYLASCDSGLVVTYALDCR
jgi:hypothetical protein